MKTIHVVAAIIRQGSSVLATQRGYGDYKGYWEFPGGKIEPGETPQEALVREIQEEMKTTVSVHEKLMTVEYDYPAFHLQMDCFWCLLQDERFTLVEATDARWLNAETISSVAWLPADRQLIQVIQQALRNDSCVL